MIALLPPDPNGFVATYASERIVVEDNHHPAERQGVELFIEIQEAVVGNAAENATCAAMRRSDAERLRNWLNAWLVKTER